MIVFYVILLLFTKSFPYFIHPNTPIEVFHTIVILYRTIFNINILVTAKNIMKQANKETLRYVAILGVSLILPTIYVIIIPYIYHYFLHTRLISMNCIFIILGN